MKKKLFYVFNFILLIILNYNMVFADELHDKIYNGAGGNGILNAGALVAGYIKYFAIAVAVIMVMYMGIKFITAAREGKAEVKKQIIVMFIGMVILFFMVAVFNWIQTLTNNSINQINGPS